MSGLAEVLAAHRRREVWEPPGNMIGWSCSCGWGSEGGYDTTRVEDHLAAAVTAFLLERLDADEVREAAAKAIFDNGEAQWLPTADGTANAASWNYATAALAAVKSALGGA